MKREQRRKSPEPRDYAAKDHLVVLGAQLGNSASVAAGDFNGDGKLDLAVIDRSVAAIFVLVQK